MTLKEIISNYTEIAVNSQKRFYKTITEKTERNILTFIIRLLGKFTQKEGYFSDKKSNERILLELDKGLKSAYLTSGIIEDTEELLREFDLSEKLIKQYYRKSLKSTDQKGITDLFKELRPKKTSIIDELTKNLLDYDFVSVNVFADIKDEMFNAIVFNSKVSTLSERISNLVVSDGKDSKLLRYTKQVSNDFLLQYQRTINQSAATRLGLDGFFFTNSLIDTSRQNCIDMVTGTGKVAEFAIKAGLYRYKDIPLIFEALKGGYGWNDATTIETYLIYLNGFNCRHVPMPVRILEDDFENEDLKEIFINEG